MMNWYKFKKWVLEGLNLKKQAEDLNISIWQSPSFLFIVMGLIIIAAMFGIYLALKNYDFPNVIIISESLTVIVFLTIGNFVIRSIEQVARANKIKTEFVSIASHQLKTPISEINWQIELLLSKFPGGLSEKQQLLIGQIAHSSQKMARLVDDLLDVARIDQGRLSLMKEEIDLCDLVNESIKNQRPFSIVSGVELKSNFSNASVKVSADKKRIGVVLDNLLSNAIKYTPKQGIVEVFWEAKDGNVQVCIRDNGVGIPKNEQGDIFKKFFRSNNSMKNNADGTGLGLYIAKNIIEQSGGKIWFQSIENVGSEFFFSLPTV